MVRSDHSRIEGLDGLRGMAVAMVLGFHLYPRLVPGGWLGVSLFFTLSGFLITTVILRDTDAGSFRFGSFYLRRVRRLVPAAMLVLALFAVSWTLLGWFDKNHRTDVFFAMLQIANWQQIWEGVPYGTALASPVVHYWSLAIEEQAYVLLPLLIVVSGARRLTTVATVLFGGSIAATILANGDESLVYFGTHTRAAEILAGVIAATLVHRNLWNPERRLAAGIAIAGIGYLVVAATLVHLGDDIVYGGGLIATGVISAMVIASLPRSRLARWMDNRAMAWLGTVSYGVYLIHWPVLMTLKRTDLPQWSVSPLTLAATLVIATVMHRRFEMPIRTNISLSRFLLTTGAVVMVALAAFPLAVRPPASFEDIEKEIQQTVQPSPILDTPRIFYFGDSKMALFYKSLQNRISQLNDESINEELFSMSGAFTRIGCPIGPLGYMINGDKEQKVGDGCNWALYDTGREQGDIAVIWGGTWDTTDRKIVELFGDGWVNLENADYRRWIAGQYENLFEHLRTRHGVKIIALIDYLGLTMTDRQKTYSDFLMDFDIDDVVFLDLTSYLSDLPIRDYLPDGSHVSIGEPTDFSPSNDNSGADLYERWFEPALCAALSEKAPDLLGDRTCPAIDYTPRVVRD